MHVIIPLFFYEPGYGTCSKLLFASTAADTERDLRSAKLRT